MYTTNHFSGLDEAVAAQGTRYAESCAHGRRSWAVHLALTIGMLLNPALRRMDSAETMASP